jgi:hypothetical protein
MFNSKKTILVVGATPKASVPSTNAFVNAGLKKSAETLSGNGALKYDSTGNDFVDQFGKLGTYKVPRAYDEIAKDASTLWGVNALLSVCFILYLRMITRVVSLFDGTKMSTVQRGAGLRHEAIVRMIWLHVNHPDTFWKNITLFISVGSWKDIIQMMSYDLQYNGWSDRILDWDKFGQLILAGLENPNSSELVKKYLPQIKANSKCTTIEAQADNMIAKGLCSLLYGGKTEINSHANYVLYRKLKSSGTAHQWQQLISKGKFLEINFDTVHGRALAQLVSGKFIENNNLTEKYEAWIDSKPIAKFTGYAHELFLKLPQKMFQIKTLNAQFLGLVETAKQNASGKTGMIVVRDTSSSMNSTAPGIKMSCGDIGKALALFFSHMLPEGAFANSYIEFNSDAKMHKWKGSTPMEKWNNDGTSYIGSTNFQSVIQLFIRLKKQGVPESEFPSGIICISDSEFNPAQLNQTNVDYAFALLRSAFSEEYVSKFKIVLWNLQSNYYGRGTGEKFETHGDVKNVFYFSGYDASVLAFLTGVEKKDKVFKEPETAAELFAAAMDQEILNLVTI